VAGRLPGESRSIHFSLAQRVATALARDKKRGARGHTHRKFIGGKGEYGCQGGASEQRPRAARSLAFKTPRIWKEIGHTQGCSRGALLTKGNRARRISRCHDASAIAQLVSQTQKDRKGDGAGTLTASLTRAD